MCKCQEWKVIGYALFAKFDHTMHNFNQINEDVLKLGWTQRTRTFPWRCCEESKEGEFRMELKNYCYVLYLTLLHFNGK